MVFQLTNTAVVEGIFLCGAGVVSSSFACDLSYGELLPICVGFGQFGVVVVSDWLLIGMVDKEKLQLFHRVRTAQGTIAGPKSIAPGRQI